MTEYLEKEANMAFTENGAVTYSSTGSHCLDLFSTIGGLRNADEQEIAARFIRAYTENPHRAMKLLFFARDVRGGLGERRAFRVIIRWLAVYKPESVIKNLEYFAEYGRYDDLLALFGTPCEKEMLEYIAKLFSADMKLLNAGENVSLLAKWLPSVNASSKETVKQANRLAKALGLSNAAYRKALSALRRKICIIENNLREKDYTFEYENQPSKAMLKYQKAFIRNDSERYGKFLSDVSKGKRRLNAGNIAPYELVNTYLKASDKKAIENSVNAAWESLPDFGGNENAIAIVDTSGSMYCGGNPMPASVAISLGIYFGERNKGAFGGSFIEFSEKPQLIRIKGETFVDKLNYICSFNEVANTNLEAVFDLILNTAIKNKLKQESLPSKLIIISDMEFDWCVENSSLTNFENAREKFQRNGYKLPQIVFWNVSSRNNQQPVTQNEQGVALVSGATPRLFRMVADGSLSPYKLMLEVLESERYSLIAA